MHHDLSRSQCARQFHLCIALTVYLKNEWCLLALCDFIASSYELGFDLLMPESHLRRLAWLQHQSDAAT